MPAINLRLTDEQHQLLVDAAHSHRRSLQKEIVERLFGVALPEGERGSAATRSPSESATAGGTEEAIPPEPDPALEVWKGSEGVSFKPDFKAEKKKRK